MNKVLIALVKAYRWAVSPFLGNHCRFSPSCSAYAEESLERKSFFEAIFLILGRVLRCQPFCRGGHDPVP